MPRCSARAFTILELMIVVAIIGILAAVAVVSYSRFVRTARATEVAYMFGEFKAKEEARHAEFGRYLGACNAALPAEGTPDSSCTEGDYWPVVLVTNPGMNITGGLPTRWQRLRIQPGKGSLYCQYEVISGPGGQNSNMGAIGTELFAEYTSSIPPRNWFYMMAQCDWDNSAAQNAVYWQRGDLNKIGNNGHTAR